MKRLWKSGCTPFDRPGGPRAALRHGVRLLVVMVTVVVLVDMLGEPLLRWEYRYRGPHSDPTILSGTYYGFSGRHEVWAGEHAHGCPLILWRRPEPPLHRRLFAIGRSHP